MGNLNVPSGRIQFSNMMMKHFLILGLFTSLGIGLSVASEKDKPEIPFNKGVEAIEKAEFEEAMRWFRVTREDFPQLLLGKQALIHESLLWVADELTRLKLANYLRERGEWKRLERSNSRDVLTLETLEKQAKEANENLESLAEVVFETKGLDLPIQVNTPTLPEGLDELRGRLAKGDLLTESEMKTLEKGERQTNYLGLLGKVLGLSDEELLSNPKKGQVKVPELLFVFSTRLLIAAERFSSQSKYEKAQIGFEKIMSMTESDPYAEVRQSTKDLIKKIPKKMILEKDGK